MDRAATNPQYEHLARFRSLHATDPDFQYTDNEFVIWLVDKVVYGENRDEILYVDDNGFGHRWQDFLVGAAGHEELAREHYMRIVWDDVLELPGNYRRRPYTRIIQGDILEHAIPPGLHTRPIQYQYKDFKTEHIEDKHRGIFDNQNKNE